LQIPLAASWHTNVHEYAERRSLPFLAALPGGLAGTAGHLIRESSFQIVAQLYHGAQVLYAPNQELCDLLQRTTGKPCFLMQRGVDTHLFDPARRDRSGEPFTLGYIGRITPEKNVEMLIELEKGLLAAGVPEFRIAVVGQGHSEPLLRQALQCGDFPGVLKGEPLARAFANLDLFIFPSETDTFGNVVLEALASGVPALVTDKGGPKFIVRHGQTGYVAANVTEFVQRAREVMTSPDLHHAMRAAAREHALAASWDHIFEGVYHGYDLALGRTAASAA
jgi:glycosyltransferase involved in cell wall biosynthesis